MSSTERTILIDDRGTLARRFFARVLFSWLFGMGVSVYYFASALVLSVSLPMALNKLIAATALIFTVNSAGIGIVTYTTRQKKHARPPLWVLPASFGLIAGVILAALTMADLTDLYPTAIAAFVVGAISGMALGITYALSIPGLRQETILKQTRRSLIIGGVVGLQLALYFFMREMPENARGIILVRHIIDALVSVPITVMGMLLSFVLGIEMGDRSIERQS